VDYGVVTQLHHFHLPKEIIMAGTTVSDLNGLFKQAYADEIVNLIPEASLVTRSVAFQGRDKMMGDQYNQPVILRAEQGFTYAAPGSGAFTINPPVTMVTKNAVVTGFQMLERAGLDYESVFKAANVNAFKDAVDLSMENAMESFGKRLELALLYGQSATGLGTVDSSVNTNTTTTVIAFTTGQWASGIWAGSEGALLDVYQNNGSTKINANAAVVVSAVDVINKKLTVTGNATDVAAVDTYLAGANGGVLRYYGATSNEMAGLDKILTNTGSLFGIDASAYALWGANTYAVGGALTLAKLQSAVALAVARGLTEDVDVLVNPSTWSNLLTEQAALRMYDSSFSSAKTTSGSKAIEFFSQNGKMTIHPHIYVKEGEAFALPFDRAVRVGSSDITFNIPGTDDGKVFQQRADNAGFEYRIYTQQSLLVETPAKCIKLTGIVNS
jgi:hypothetical protein